MTMFNYQEAMPGLRQRVARLKLLVSRSKGMAGLPEWLINNTRDPVDSSQPFSFRNHEYQIDLLSSEYPHSAVMKCSQVGVSEISLRAALGMANLFDGTHWIYSLPSTGFARKFCATRVDPVIDASPLLTQQLNADADSTEVKGIGRSFLYFVGAQKQSQAISVPCKGLIRDEIDFCNQRVLTTLQSRLNHQKSDQEVIRDFSTPTVPDYGIDTLFKDGTKKVYMVYHSICGNWVVADPLRHLVIPGFDELIINFSKEDLRDPRVKVEESFVKCDHCHQPISQENLANPDLRAWVPEHPDREMDSFYVSPLDLPAINTPRQIITNLSRYESISDWINFGLGKAHLPAGAAVAPDALRASHTGVASLPGTLKAYGSGIGVDVGKISHLISLERIGSQYIVHWLEKIRQKVHADGTDDLSVTILKRIEQFKAYKSVIDAMPDITAPKKVIELSVYGSVWASYFVRSLKSLEVFALKEDEQIVNIARTKIFDEMVKDINAGLFVFPRHPDTELLFEHLKKLRKIRRISESTGEEVSAWVSSDDDDHYAFALVYAYAACKMMEAGTATTIYIPPSAMMSKARMKAN